MNARPVITLAGWLVWALSLILALRRGLSGGGLALTAGAATLVALVFVRLAGLARRAGVGPTAAAPPSDEPRGATPTMLSDDGARVESSLRLALGSRDYFEGEFLIYLGSLAQGHPLRGYELWWGRSTAAGEARKAFARAMDDKPQAARAGRFASLPRRLARLRSWLDRPALEDIEKMTQRMEEAYERERRPQR